MPCVSQSAQPRPRHLLGGRHVPDRAPGRERRGGQHHPGHAGRRRVAALRGEALLLQRRRRRLHRARPTRRRARRAAGGWPRSSSPAGCPTGRPTASSSSASSPSWARSASRPARSPSTGRGAWLAGSRRLGAAVRRRRGPRRPGHQPHDGDGQREPVRRGPHGPGDPPPLVPRGRHLRRPAHPVRAGGSTSTRSSARPSSTSWSTSRRAWPSPTSVRPPTRAAADADDGAAAAPDPHPPGQDARHPGRPVGGHARALEVLRGQRLHGATGPWPASCATPSATRSGKGPRTSSAIDVRRAMRAEQAHLALLARVDRALDAASGHKVLAAPVDTVAGVAGRRRTAVDHLEGAPRRPGAAPQPALRRAAGRHSPRGAPGRARRPGPSTATATPARRRWPGASWRGTLATTGSGASPTPIARSSTSSSPSSATGRSRSPTWPPDGPALDRHLGDVATPAEGGALEGVGRLVDPADDLGHPVQPALEMRSTPPWRVEATEMAHELQAPWSWTSTDAGLDVDGHQRRSPPSLWTPAA